jgi:hypothetical protein
MPKLMRKAISSGLHAGLGALATIAARRTASFIRRRTTGQSVADQEIAEAAGRRPDTQFC